MTAFVITGTAGAGKTALLNAVSRNSAALDLDVLGVHYRNEWINIIPLIDCAYYQGFRWFGGVFNAPAFDELSKLDPDIRIFYLQPDPESLQLRNDDRRKRGEKVRWSFDRVKVTREFDQLTRWAAIHHCGLWRLERLVDMARVDKKGGSADDSDLKKWRVAFPAPMSIGWNQEGTDPTLDKLLTEWLGRLDKDRLDLIKFAKRFSGDFSKSRWRHFFDVYDPKLGQLTAQIWDAASSKGFEQKRRSDVLNANR